MFAPPVERCLVHNDPCGRKLFFLSRHRQSEFRYTVFSQILITVASVSDHLPAVMAKRIALSSLAVAAASLAFASELAFSFSFKYNFDLLVIYGNQVLPCRSLTHPFFLFLCLSI